VGVSLAAHRMATRWRKARPLRGRRCRALPHRVGAMPAPRGRPPPWVQIAPTGGELFRPFTSSAVPASAPLLLCAIRHVIARAIWLRGPSAPAAHLMLPCQGGLLSTLSRTALELRRCVSPTLSMQPDTKGYDDAYIQDRLLQRGGEWDGMSYRNKTYVAFASEDIKSYRLMEAWRDNDNIDFSFVDAHDLVTALDTSQPETIRRRLRVRLNNTKQVVLLGSAICKSKAAKTSSFIHYEVETIIALNLPVVVANLDGDRKVDRAFIPQAFLDEDHHTLSVSFQSKIIMHALDNYAVNFSASTVTGPHQYDSDVYTRLDL
jgi:hypothetical protein